jgi:hypothetical protein
MNEQIRPNNPRPTIYWLLAAQRKLRAAMAEIVAQCADDMLLCVSVHRDRVSRELKRCFPDAEGVIVLDWLTGYRPKLHLHCLLVEIVENSAEGESLPTRRGHIVKVQTVLPPEFRPPTRTESKAGEESPAAPSEGTPPKKELREIEKEWEGYSRSCPPGMDADSVLASLKPLYDGEELVGLLYGDVTSILGASRITTLEDGFMSAIRFGTPTAESLEAAIRRIFGVLSERFYHQSYTETDPDKVIGDKSWLCEKLVKYLDRWNDRPNDVIANRRGDLYQLPSDAKPIEQHDYIRLGYRREALAVIDPMEALAVFDPMIGQSVYDTFIDPIDYLRPVFSEKAASGQAPRMRIGTAHGDLHGRNAMIGLIEDEVGSIGIFDFEDVDPDNLLVWDFVKLETETKIRAYPIVFGQLKLDRFVKSVHEFEVGMAKQTESFNEIGQWPAIAESMSIEQQRLLTLIRTIRAEAFRCLGRRLQRRHEWLEEYYFGLACYGAQSMSFPNVEQFEEMGAYISAGTAAARLSIPWRQLPDQIAQAKREAEAIIKESQSMDAAAIENLAMQCGTFHLKGPVISVHPKFLFASLLVRSTSSQHLESKKAAIRLLERLHIEYPHVLAIEQELLLALLETGLSENEAYAGAVLEKLSQRYVQPNTETLCRRARIYKDRGIDSKDDASRTSLIRLSRTIYEQAYQIAEEAYPGINVATLDYMLGEWQKAQALAETILRNLTNEADLWIDATRGEAYLLAGKSNEAKDAYTRLVQRPGIEARDVGSARKQIARLREYMVPEIKAEWSDAELDRIFGESM